MVYFQNAHLDKYNFLISLQLQILQPQPQILLILVFARVWRSRNPATRMVTETLIGPALSSCSSESSWPVSETVVFIPLELHIWMTIRATKILPLCFPSRILWDWSDQHWDTHWELFVWKCTSFLAKKSRWKKVIPIGLELGGLDFRWLAA